MEKKTFVRIKPGLDGDSWLIERLENAIELLKEYIEQEEGDFSVEFIKMTEEEFEAIPEL